MTVEIRSFVRVLLAAFAWMATVAGAFLVGNLLAPQETRTVYVAPEAEAAALAAGEQGMTAPEAEAAETRAFADLAGAPAEGDAVPYESPKAPALDAEPPPVEVVSAPVAPAAPGAPKSPEQMADLIRRINGETNIRERHKLVSEALASMTKDNAAATVKALMDVGSDSENLLELRLLMSVWGEMDGAAAMAFLDQNRSSQTRQLRSDALESWAKTEPGSALQWARNNWKGEDNPYLIPVISGMVPRDPYGAFDVVRDMPYGATRGRALNLVLDSMWKQNPNGVAPWAYGLEDGMLKDSVTARVSGYLAGRDPMGAIQWASSLSSPEGRVSALSAAATRWAWSQPQQALGWVSSIEDASVQRKLFNPVFSTWVQKDHDQAGAWLSQQPAAPMYDPARQNLAYRLADHHPEQAIAWASGITDQRSRFQVTDRIVRNWINRDPAKAQAYLGVQPAPAAPRKP